MKTQAYFAISTLLLALGCENDPGRELVSPEMDVLSVGASASGHGNWFNAAGEYVSRSFHGIVKDGGIVEGNFVQHVTAVTGEKRVNKSTVDCLRLLGPNEAVLSGTVEENITPSLIGQIQIFRIQDNGEGSNEEYPDRMSALVFRQPGLGINCSNLTPLPAVTPIEGGNLQVKP
jgi:hypothetical protein